MTRRQRKKRNQRAQARHQLQLERDKTVKLTDEILRKAQVDAIRGVLRRKKIEIFETPDAEYQAYAEAFTGLIEAAKARHTIENGLPALPRKTHVCFICDGVGCPDCVP